MQKKTSFKKVVCLTTALSFGFAVLYPYTSRANPLAPISFNEMYSLAQRGDVESLRASVRRGMNIDVMKSNGDTGLCIAAKNHDSYTYNSFRAAGANPRHPCTQNIPDYQRFVESSRAVPVTAAPREAYSEIGRESYSISPRVWWILGGVALIGGITALILSHNSGGKSKHHGSDDDDKHQEDYHSLGAIAATKGKTLYKTSSSELNNKKVTVANDKITREQANNIDLTTDVLNTTDYLFQGFLAQKGGTYTNKATGVIELGTATIGMTALKESEIINNGYIKADSFNATVAMVASEGSTAINNAYGIIDDESTLGIDLNFKGDSITQTVVGMYADTNSKLINNGDIRGTATKSIAETANSGTDENGLVSILDELIGSATASATTAIKGRLIGMEAMILNTGSDVRDNRIILTNTKGGYIKLSAGDSGSTSSTINLMTVGMGSFLDMDFLDGSKNINRAESVILTNEGQIDITYTGRYEAASDAPLRKGTGGAVGMRAEANTTATNEKDAAINITLTDNFSSAQSNAGTNDNTGVDTAAGMQSLHGASMINNGTIKILTNSKNPVVNYGMLAAEGSGRVSGLYTSTKQVLDNNGAIYIEASNSYGMASYNGGTLNNNKGAVIVVGKDMSNSAAQNDADTQYTNNIGMYGAGNSTSVTLNNYGEIHVYSQKSAAMRNDFSGAQEIRNENKIHLHFSATDSVVFAGYYSRLVNNGIIIYDLSEPGNPSEIGSAEDPFEKYSTKPSSGSSARKSVMTTKSLGESSSSTTEALYNNQGKTITMNGSSYTSVMSVETKRGYAINNGTINLKQNQFGTEGNGIGMYADSNTISAAYLQNLGLIETNFYMSAAMASESTQNAAVINDGIITTQHEYSMGMYANGKSLLTNNNEININASNSVAIYTTNAGSSSITNSKTGTINIGDQRNVLSNTYGLFSKVDSATTSNYGTIEIYGNNSTAIKTAGSNAVIKNDNKISGAYTKGIEASGEKTRIENLRGNDSEYGQILGALQCGIYTTGAETTINNVGDIGEPEGGPSTGIYTEGEKTNVTNAADGRIYATNTGIYTTGENTGVNNAGIIGSETAGPVYGIYADGSSPSLSNTGTIYASNTGIYALEANATITNSGQIGSADHRPIYGIRAEKPGANITNTATIYSSDTGIYVHTGSSNQTTVINSGTINSGLYGIYAVINNNNDKLTITNTGTIIAGTGIFAEHRYKKPEEPEKYIVINTGGASYDESYYPSEDSTTTTSSAFFALSLHRVNIENVGLMRATSELDFDDSEVSYAVGPNGSYQAPSLSGTVLASAAIVQDGFEDVYTNADSFIGEDEGIRVVSASYMYDANTAQNANGNTDIVLTRKPFAELTNNASLAAFLERNYQNENNDALYQNLKVAAEENSFANALNEYFGLDTIPNFAKQNLDAERILNTEINDDLLQETGEENRHMAKVTIYKNDVDGKGGVTGYKDTIISAYGIRDTRINNNWRAGFGLSVLRDDTKYDNHAKRYNNVLEIMAPVTFQKENLSALIKPKAGFGRGHYRRPTEDDVYKTDTKEYYYGADTAAKYTADFDVVTLEPNVGFSLTGMYSESMHEKTGGLKIKNKNIVSALSSVGVDIGKAFEITSNQSVSLGAGGKYYHEFGNKYSDKAFVSGMDGFYKVKSNRFNRNFGLMSLKAGYNYNGFTVQASANVPVETKHNTYYMLNLGYKF